VSELPQPVRDFLDGNIFSASQLEVLLLLREGGADKTTLSELSRRTALPQSSLGPWLDAFVSRGLLDRDGDRYWFAPGSADLEQTLAEVAETWRRRKTTVTRYIYASTEDPLLRFADAFRLRRPDPHRED
jgi:DNA-binding transcriptional ArsR family regulator